MSWFALISLIFTAIRTAEDLWPQILRVLDAIDAAKPGPARVEARRKLGAELQKYKDGDICSVACAANLAALQDEVEALSG